MSEQADYPVFASRGRAYVYILPWRDEDLLKLGFSRDPLQRLRSLHRRFHEVFDLERGWLIEAPRVAMARKIEREFLTRWHEQRAPAPLVVREAAAGYTEWYRGIHADVVERAHAMARAEALPLHRLKTWLAARLHERVDWLYQGAARTLEHVLYLRFNGAEAAAFEQERVLLDLLALCETVGLDLDRVLSEPVRAWYRDGTHRALFT